MIQIGTIKYVELLVSYFAQFVWIEKKSHYNSRVSLHEAPTKSLLENHAVANLLQFFPVFLRIQKTILR